MKSKTKGRKKKDTLKKLLSCLSFKIYALSSFFSFLLIVLSLSHLKYPHLILPSESSIPSSPVGHQNSIVPGIWWLSVAWPGLTELWGELWSHRPALLGKRGGGQGSFGAAKCWEDRAVEAGRVFYSKPQIFFPQKIFEMKHILSPPRVISFFTLSYSQNGDLEKFKFLLLAYFLENNNPGYGYTPFPPHPGNKPETSLTVWPWGPHNFILNLCFSSEFWSEEDGEDLIDCINTLPI